MINELSNISEILNKQDKTNTTKEEQKRQLEELKKDIKQLISFYFSQSREENKQESELLKAKYKNIIELFNEISSYKTSEIIKDYTINGEIIEKTIEKAKYNIENNVVFDEIEKEYDKQLTQYTKEKRQLNKINTEELKEKLIDEFNYQLKQYKSELKTKNIIYLLNDEEVKEKIIETIAETTEEKETLKKLYNPTLKQFKNNLSITIEHEKQLEKTQNQIKIPKMTKFYIGLKVTRKLLKI